eukprot:TRINITY_DN7265_c0_g1_i8.p1 TRINITY_DN7265_c0_g1~~TRINITY_DN7265_c0_g1_i8.p1  ORF type:complete len:102 (-),score=5.21 TRINITY_DN7265_c0_g1_i8:100-405(-)
MSVCTVAVLIGTLYASSSFHSALPTRNHPLSPFPHIQLDHLHFHFLFIFTKLFCTHHSVLLYTCLLYTSDAADEEDSVDLGGRRIIKKKKKNKRGDKRKIK